MTSPSDIIRAASAPIRATGGLRTLSLTTSDATIDLATGVYEALNTGSAHAVASLSESTASLPPSSGATEAAGAFIVPAGGAATFGVDASTTLHAKILSGTGTLYLHRKAVL